VSTQLRLFDLRRDGTNVFHRVYTSSVNGHVTEESKEETKKKTEEFQTKRISNEPFRRAMLREMSQGVTLSEVCRRLDWMDSRDRPEVGRLRRSLGMLPLEEWENGDNCHSPMLQVSVQKRVAVKLCEAFGLAPTEVGL
jgi:hypothetical protein